MVLISLIISELCFTTPIQLIITFGKIFFIISSIFLSFIKLNKITELDLFSVSINFIASLFVLVPITLKFLFLAG